MNLRFWIARTLWADGISLAIAVISGLLSLVLAESGDLSAAKAVFGVTLVSLTVFVLGLATLVIILALNELQRTDASRSNSLSGSSGSSDQQSSE